MLVHEAIRWTLVLFIEVFNCNKHYEQKNCRDSLHQVGVKGMGKKICSVIRIVILGIESCLNLIFRVRLNPKFNVKGLKPLRFGLSLNLYLNPRKIVLSLVDFKGLKLDY